MRKWWVAFLAFTEGPVAGGERSMANNHGSWFDVDWQAQSTNKIPITNTITLANTLLTSTITLTANTILTTNTVLTNTILTINTISTINYVCHNHRDDEPCLLY